MLFSLEFANNTILWCFFFFVLIVDQIILNYCFLVLAVIAQIFTTIIELVTPIGISSEKAKKDIEIHPVTVGDKIGQHCLRLYKSFSASYLSIHICLFPQCIFFVYSFQSKFLTYVIFIHIFIVILYFKLSRDFGISQLILLLNSQRNCKRKKKELLFVFKNVWYFRILKSSILTANDRIEFLAFLFIYLNLNLILTSSAI